MELPAAEEEQGWMMRLDMRLTSVSMEIITLLYIHLQSERKPYDKMIEWLTTKHGDLVYGKFTPLYLINTGRAAQVHEYLDKATHPGSEGDE